MIRLFGGRLRISPLALILFLIILCSPDGAFLLIMLCCALFHEVGHLIAMRGVGCAAEQVNIYPFGAELVAGTGRLSYRDEIIVALSGPAVSLTLSLLLLPLYTAFGGAYLLCALLSNIVYFAVNILPVKSLDGGRALFSLLLSRLELMQAYTVYNTIATVGFAVLCLFALYLLFITGYNLSLAFICAYLFISCYAKEKVCR